jgi:hypothetical protein
MLILPLLRQSFKLLLPSFEREFAKIFESPFRLEHSVNQVRVLLELVLEYRIDSLKQRLKERVIGLVGQEKGWRGHGSEEIEQFGTCRAPDAF